MVNQSEYHQFAVDPADSPTVDIIQAVARVTDTDPLSGPPLTEAVDVDALARLLQGSAHVSVTFHYEDCEIRVDSENTLRVRRAEDEVSVG